MAPEERRAALVAATVPLLCEHGAAVSTRQIADAAGVAEGTIFNVFPDKASLLREAVLAALDPEPLHTALAAIPPGALRDRLRAVVELVRQRMARNEPLIAAIRTVAGDAGHDPEFYRRLRRNRQGMFAAVATVIEPDRSALRSDPAGAARLLMMLVMASVHRGMEDPNEDPNALGDLTADDIVSLLLDGLLVRPDPGTDASTGGAAT